MGVTFLVAAPSALWVTLAPVVTCAMRVMHAFESHMYSWRLHVLSKVKCAFWDVRWCALGGLFVVLGVT